jgi:hypothetical protein
MMNARPFALGIEVSVRPMLVLMMATALSPTSVAAVWVRKRRTKSSDFPARYDEPVLAEAEQ